MSDEEAIETNPERMSIHDLKVRLDEARKIHSKLSLCLDFLDHKLSVKAMFAEELANPLCKRIDFYQGLIEKKEQENDRNDTD